MDPLLQTIADINEGIVKKEVADFAQERLDFFGLTDRGWTFGWNNRKAALGLCEYKEKRISLSLFLLNTITPSERRDTVLHEIAHALDFLARGYSDHGPKWKQWARYVGAVPRSCSKTPMEAEYSKIMKQSKWTLRCPNGHEVHFHRKVKGRHSCGICCPGGIFREEFVMEAIQNY